MSRIDRPRGKILCVASSYPRWPGDATPAFVHHIARNLGELGWEITVLAPHAAGCLKKESLEGVTVHRFQYLWPARLETVCYQGGMLINTRNSPLAWCKIPIFLFMEWLHVHKTLRESGPFDLIHSHWIIPQGFTCGLAGLLTGTPHVTTAHGSDVLALNNPRYQPFKRFALRHADAVTVNSSATENAARRILPEVRNLVRIPMGASLPSKENQATSVDIRKRYRSGNGPLLLFVGRIIEEKGVGDLLLALKLIRAGLPDARLLIAGEGRDRDRFQTMARQLGVADLVVFTGWVAPEEVGAYYLAADIFIAPSKKSAEGGTEAQGLTIVEAMLAQTPVIGSRTGGITDTVIDGKTGLLIDPGAPAQIADAVQRLCAEPGLAERLRQEALRFATAGYTRASSANAFSELFAQVLHTRGPAARR